MGTVGAITDGTLTPFFFDEATLLALAERRADEYRAARPFPHVVIDDFLPGPVVERAIAEFPEHDDIGWALYTDRGNTLKLATEGEAEIPPYLRQLIAQLNSGPVIRFLERLTGFDGLVADPHLMGGGLHRVEPGGFLKIHADFNRHPILRLERRLNLLLYLNDVWDTDWGGALELWDSDACRERIVPIANRCVIFNTTEASLHGHPEPVACPPGTARRSLALYYYSALAEAEAGRERHTTLYQSEGAARSAEASKLRGVAQRWLPPAVLDAYRRRSRSRS